MWLLPKCVSTLLLFSYVVGTQYQMTLDPSDKYKLTWSFEGKEPTDEITFEVVVETTGWVGLGFSPKGSMKGADIVVGWVDYEGKAHIEDRYATENGFSPLDASQDITLISLEEWDGRTKMKFKRKLNTCDKEHDYVISNDASRLIYAYGSDDPFNNVFSHTDKHIFQARGARTVYLVDPSPDIQSVPREVLSHKMAVSNVKVPSTDTTYHCSFHKMPELDRKHHVLAIEAAIQPGNEALVHHIALWACWNLDDMHLQGSTAKEGVCMSEVMPEQANYCREMIYAWVVGASKFYFPKEAGYPIGGELQEDSPEYYMLEMHYDNPQLIAGQVDSSGLVFTYSPVLREMDVGMVKIGAIDGIVVPPMAPEFRTGGICHGTCTQSWVPVDGVNGFAYLLHSHLLGVAIQVDWYRNGEPIGIYAKDSNYDFNFQENRLFDSPKKLLPGDSLKVTCTLDSTERNSPVFGGNGTYDEMCQILLMYYPRQKISRCESIPTFIDDLNNPAYSLFGVTAGSDETVAGRLKFQDAFNSIDWNEKAVSEAQKLIDTTPLVTVCEGYNITFYKSHRTKFLANDFQPILKNTSPDTCESINERKNRNAATSIGSGVVILVNLFLAALNGIHEHVC